MGFDKSLFYVRVYYTNSWKLIYIEDRRQPHHSQLQNGRQVLDRHCLGSDPCMCSLEFSSSITIVWKCLKMNNSVSDLWISCAYLLWFEDPYHFLFSEQRCILKWSEGIKQRPKDQRASKMLIQMHVKIQYGNRNGIFKDQGHWYQAKRESIKVLKYSQRNTACDHKPQFHSGLQRLSDVTRDRLTGSQFSYL